MRIWWVTNKQGIILGLLRRVYNIPRIIRTLLDDDWCEFEIREDAPTRTVYRVTSSKKPKWDEVITVEGKDFPLDGNAAVWWLSDNQHRFLGIVPDQENILPYLEIVYAAEDVGITVEHDEPDLIIYDVRWLDDSNTVITIRATLLRLQ